MKKKELIRKAMSELGKRSAKKNRYKKPYGQMAKDRWKDYKPFDREKAKELRKQGKSYTEIGKIVGVSKQRVRYMFIEKKPSKSI